MFFSKCILWADKEESEPRIKTLQTSNVPKKKLVQEIKPTRKQSEFAKNLQKKFQSDEGNNGSNKSSESGEVKLYETLNKEIEAVSTKRISAKKPLFGRAINPKNEEVRLKFLLNGVDDKKSVFFFLPEKVLFLLQNF